MNKKQIKKILKDFLEFDQQYQLDEDAYDYFADQIIGLDNQLTWWKKELGSYTLADVTSALIAEK
jgi:hypothetical protein